MNRVDGVPPAEARSVSCGPRIRVLELDAVMGASVQTIYGVTVLNGTRLGIDFGTSNTVAVVAGRDGPARPLLFDGAPALPSAVCRQPDGTLLVGRDAWHAARMYPEAFDPHPKRAVDDTTVLLGDAELAVVDVFAAVLRRVADEASRITAGAPDAVTLTCPAAWGSRRRAVLADAARAAGLGEVRLCPEPVAAAAFFADQPGAGPAVGAHLLVYDLGAGTFDASVVRRTDAGFEVLATRGLSDAGGLDVDAAVLDMLGATYAARDPAAWRRLTGPVDAGDRRAARALWDDVRSAKELLSRVSTAFVPVPLYAVDAPVSREQLDELAAPVLERTVKVTSAALRDAGLAGTPVDRICLVGGASRMPVVATMLHRRFGVVPTVLEQPELVVALGSVRAGPAASGPAAPVVRGPADADADRPDHDDADRDDADRDDADRDGVQKAGAARAADRDLPEPAAVDTAEPAAVHSPEPAEFHAPKRPARDADELARRRIAAVVGALVAAILIVIVMAQLPGDGQPTGASAGPDASASSTPALPDRTWSTRGGAVWGMAVSADGRRVAAAGEDGSIRLSDTVTGEPVMVLAGHTGRLWSVAFSPDGLQLASGGADSTVRLWDLATRTEVGRIATSSYEDATDLEFNHDGSLLAMTTDEAGPVRIIDVATRRPVRDLDTSGQYPGVSNLAFTPDGRLLAGGAANETVRLWEVGSGRIVATLPVPTAEVPGVRVRNVGVRALAFSPDGATLAIGCADPTVRLWDVATQRLRATAPGHSANLDELVFSPDGERLVSAADDGEVRVWNAATAQPLAVRNAMRSPAVVGFGPDGRA